MARVDWRLVVVVFLAFLAVVLSADNATTPAPTTPAPKPTTPAPSKHGILENIETFLTAIPVGLATACQTGAQAVKDFFQNPWW